MSAFMSAFIKFNVGGETFQTTKDTLLSEPNTLFDFILDGRWKVEKDSTGAILLDRDPRYFRALLNYLRTRQIVLDDGVSADGVRLEAEYFMVQGALEGIEKHGDESQQLIAMVVDARPGKLISIRMGHGNDGRCVIPEDPVSFHLQREAIIALTMESVASENVHFVVEDAGALSKEFIVHSGHGRAEFRAIARLPAGPHALTVRCQPCQIGAPAFVQGPARLEVWRYPSGLAIWRKALNIYDPASGVELLECGAVQGGCGTQHAQDPSALADAIRAIATSAYT